MWGEDPDLVPLLLGIKRILLMSEKKKSQDRNMEFMDEGRNLDLRGPKKAYHVKQHEKFKRRKNRKRYTESEHMLIL